MWATLINCFAVQSRGKKSIANVEINQVYRRLGIHLIVCTRGLMLVRILATWFYATTARLLLHHHRTPSCQGRCSVASQPHRFNCDVAQTLSWRKTLRALRGLSKTGVCRWSSNEMLSFHTRIICNVYDLQCVWFHARMTCNTYSFKHV